MLDSGGNYSSVIVLGELLVASVEDCFIAGVLNDSGLEVVRDKETSYSAEVFVCMDMSVKPVFELRVGGGFGVCVSAAWQYGYEEIRWKFFTCHRVVDG